MITLFRERKLHHEPIMANHGDGPLIDRELSIKEPSPDWPLVGPSPAWPAKTMSRRKLSFPPAHPKKVYFSSFVSFLLCCAA